MGRPSRPSRPQNQNMQNMQNMQQMQQMQGQQMNYSQQNVNMQKQNMNFQNPNGSQEDFMNQLQERKRKRNKLLIILLCSILGLALLGVLVYFIGSARWSSRVQELESTVQNMETNYNNMVNSKNSEINKLKEAVADTTVLETEKTTSLQTIEGQYVPQMWLLNGEFISPNPLELPNSTEGINDSYIQIGQKFVFRPSDRWMFVAKGATFELSHPMKIWGKLRSIGIKEPIPQADMKNIIQSFFIGYPATEITYRSIYIEDRIVGMIGKANVTVRYNASENQAEIKTQADLDRVIQMSEEGLSSDTVEIEEKDVVLNVGFIQRSDFALTFLFLNDADGGSNSQELIDLFLRTGSFGVNGSGIKLEQ